MEQDGAMGMRGAGGGETEGSTSNHVLKMQDYSCFLHASIQYVLHGIECSTRHAKAYLEDKEIQNPTHLALSEES